jgi:uncharacterized protein YndB with AHSA1/START domain
MPDILLEFPIKATPDRVFEAISTPAGLDAWWTLRAAGKPEAGAVYDLGFGPGYDWRARVTRYEPARAFELEFVEADIDWTGTRVGVELESRGALTRVSFHHTRWPTANAHFRITCNCWALYLRLLRRFVERGEQVPYDERLDA